MLEQPNLLEAPELVLQRLDKIAAELQLLREAVVTIQARSEKMPEPQNSLTHSVSEAKNLLPDLRDFRASLMVHGDSLRSVVLREREEQRY
jgi:hypothetical protein